MKKKRKKTKVMHFAGITLLCAFCTVLLLFLVSENYGAYSAKTSDVMSLSTSFIGIFVVLLIAYLIYKVKK
ncbi:hypothetical protein KY337_05795 [Candidatus Woesearchaeota archaeon]|nr:hypothetical protein [Candidatus Woesearchaeota archaeon]